MHVHVYLITVSMSKHGSNRSCLSVGYLPPESHTDAVFGAIACWIADAPRPLQNPQDLVALLDYKFSRIMLDRGEAFSAEYIGAVRHLQAMLPDVVTLEGAYLHLGQEAPHVHSYYQRKCLPAVTR